MERQRTMWAAGDYATLSTHIKHVGERVVDCTGVEPGMRVLDVACGTGNAALPAARAGARVTGLDLLPELLEAGRADSTRPDWRSSGSRAPEGSVGEVLRASGSYMLPPPDFASPPILWGTEGPRARCFGSVASGFEFERHSATIEWESIEGFGDFFMDCFGPLVTARQSSASASKSCERGSSRSGVSGTRRTTGVGFPCKRPNRSEPERTPNVAILATESGTESLLCDLLDIVSGPGGQQILLDDDIAAEVERLRSASLQFRNDGSGNPIELFQPAAL